MAMLYEGFGLQYMYFCIWFKTIPKYSHLLNIFVKLVLNSFQYIDILNEEEGLCAHFELLKLAYIFTMSTSIASHVRN